MNEIRARKVLGNIIQSESLALYGNTQRTQAFIDWKPESLMVAIRGQLTSEELDALSWWITYAPILVSSDAGEYC